MTRRLTGGGGGAVRRRGLEVMRVDEHATGGSSGSPLIRLRAKCSSSEFYIYTFDVWFGAT